MLLSLLLIVVVATDLVKEEQARDQYEKIKSFVAGTVAEGAPIIPVSAQLQYNIDIVAQYIACYVPIPKRDFVSPARLLVIRSFDVNKPGADVENIKVGWLLMLPPRRLLLGVVALHRSASLCVCCVCREASLAAASRRAC